MHADDLTNLPAEEKDESSVNDSSGNSFVEAAPAPLRVDLDYADRVNFAMQQNGVPLVEQVTILNEGDSPAMDVIITLAIENDACESWAKRFEAIPPGEAIRFEPDAHEFCLRARELAQRTEAERTMIVVTVESSLGTPVARSFPIDLLAFDHWPGVGYYPELLAAFVTPNHPRIAELLKAVRVSLGHLSEHDAIDGYQSGSRRRAALIAEAGFNAVAARAIGYIGVPASFEKQGQRVRLVDRVLRENFGNCLDLSLVLAGVWEQSGLHALVLFTEGHAMPAVWTHASHLPEPAIDEPARIRNLIELGEIVPIEATSLTKSGSTFAQAVDAAKKTLANPGTTFCAVDIRCCRKRAVRPLPLREDRETTELDLDSIDTTPTPIMAGTTLDSVALADRVELDGVALPAESEESGDDRIRRWQKRLLDLSLRNRLINFRETKGTIRLKVPDIAKLEDLLASEARLAINARAEGDDQFLREQLDAKHLYTNEPPAETSDRLLKIYRTARLSIEETGANLLHIALGMLKWYESPTSPQPRLAPLILLPVRLYRHSTGSGYRYDFGLSDEPLRPNVTLLEKLRTEFGIDTAGLEDLPEDEKGIDVPLILHRFRQAIRDTRWEVEETAHLGLFSFNKFLMWRDLREHLDRLRENRLVRHLIDREHGVFDPEPFPRAETLDDDVPPGELLCTRDADSTQLAAIRAASTNRTFVLEGPPGTGKSQTIANIIADSLGRGKRVLFVAEKMAALTVVSKRLHDDGLGPFCLELHSAKASKKEVLVQLQAALDAANISVPTDWDALCAELGITRGRLNTYVRELHQPRANGESLYQVLGRLSRLADGPRVELPTNDIAQTTAEQLAAWRNAIDALVDASETIIIPPHEHDLRGIGRSEWSFTLPAEMIDYLSKALDAIGDVDCWSQNLLLEIGKATGSFNGDTRKFGRDSVHALAVLASMLLESPAPDVRLLDGKDAPAIIADLRALIEQGKRRDRLREELASRYRPEFLDLDHFVHLDAVNRAFKRPALLRPIFAFFARRPLRPYCIGAVPSLEELTVDLDTAREAKQLTSTLALAYEAAQIFGRQWKNGEANWTELERMLAWCERYRKTADVLKREKDGTMLFKSLAKVAGESALSESFNDSAKHLVSAWKEWTTAWTAVKETLVTNGDMAFGDGVKHGWTACAEETFNRWSFANPQLNDWCVWRRARDTAAALSLTNIITRYECGELARDQLRDTFERSYGEKWFNTVANSVEAIRTFNTGSHQKTIDRFRQLDNALIQRTRDTITARLRERMPADTSQASAQSELGILRRELEKKSRHLPTRRLIGAMPNLLPRLKPCFLMSPLSVAQFLDAGLPPFDLVVFDEASQIPVWDSIGAIARGTEVIVVGDSKQLPPTTFFNTLDGEEESADEDVAIEDMESILKECNASGIPALWLKWHYRSRHESLISFSNHHYYRNELHTFPSPIDRSDALGVTFRHIEDGLYDRGNTRTNRIEANRVVDELVGLLTESDKPDSSGVVTFNQAQQSLIEDLLDAKRREVPAIEKHFTQEVDEPVFVKNLENVQGDERDTIIFSVGYGPDADGRYSMNFGPLNQDGGERRLNVAITRARKRLVVFSSLRPDHIDLKRTRALGVKHFKEFLDYAERGPRALAEVVEHTSSRDFDSGFGKAVRDALVERGWEVDTQVGCAGYRIDLGVRDPETPGRYLLGIECDGAAYHSAKTARDRDRLREAVLRNLGWKLERVWSTEWRINPERCLATIDKRLSELRNETPAALPEEHQPAPAEPTPINSIEAPLVEPKSAPVDSSNEPPVYRRTVPKDSRLANLDISQHSNLSAGIAAIEQIVREEGPIVEELALRRLAEWFGVSRLTDRVRARFNELLGYPLGRKSIIRHGDALWPADLAPSDFTIFRAPGPDDADQRDLEHIPLVERINAVVFIVHQQFGLPREELEREAAKALGLNRVTARVKELIGEAIDAAVERGLVQSAEERITLP